MTGSEWGKVKVSGGWMTGPAVHLQRSGSGFDEFNHP